MELRQLWEFFTFLRTLAYEDSLMKLTKHCLKKGRKKKGG
jgi:hypothetical protein